MLKEETEDEVTMFDGASLLGGSSSGQKRSQKRGLNTFALCGAFFGVGLALAIPGPTLNYLRCHVSATIQTISYIFPSRSLGYLVGSLLGGFLFEKFERRANTLVSLALILAGLTIAIAPWTTSLFMLCVLLSVTSIAMGFLDTGGNVLLLRLWEKDSGPYLQLLHFTFGLGACIAPLVAAPLLSSTALSCNTTVPILSSTTTVAVAVNPMHKRQFIPSFAAEYSSVANLPNPDESSDSSASPRPHLSTSNASLTTTPVAVLSKPDTGPASSGKTSFKSANGGQVNEELDKVEKDDQGENQTPFSNPVKEPVTRETSMKQTSDPVISDANSSKSDEAMFENTTIITNMVLGNNGSTVTGEESTNATVATAPNTTSPAVDGSPDSTTFNFSSSPVDSQTSRLASTEGPEVNTTSTVALSTDAVITPTMTSTASPTPPPVIVTTTASATTPIALPPTTTTPTPETTTAPTPETTTAPTPETTTAPAQETTTAPTPETITAPTPPTTVALVPETATTVIPPTTATTVIPPTTATTVIPPTTATSTPVSTTKVARTTSTDHASSKLAIIAMSTPVTTPGKMSAVTSATSPDATTTKKSRQKLKSTESTFKNSTPTNTATPSTNVSKPNTNFDGGQDDESIYEKGKELLMSISKVQFSYLFIALVMLLFGFLFCFLSERKDTLSKRRKSQNDLEEVADLMMAPPLSYRIKIMSAVFVFFFLYVGTEVSYGQFIATFSIHHNSFTERVASLLTAVYWGMFALARGLSVPLARCLSPTTMLTISLAITVCSAIGLTIATAMVNSTGALWVLSGGLGVGMAAIFPTGVLWLEGYIKVTSKMAAVFVCASALGEMVVPAIVGFSIERTGPVTLIYTTLSCVLLCAVTFVIMRCIATGHNFRYKKVGGSDPHSHGNAMTMQEFEFTDSDDDMSDREPILFNSK